MLYKKIAKAIIQKEAVKIEGGSYVLPDKLGLKQLRDEQ